MKTHDTFLSNLKRSILLFFVIFIFQIGSTQAVEPGDWSSLRLYGHAYNVNGFTTAEYHWIKNHNHIFTTEKRNARNIYGDPSSEYASNIASQQIKDNNPSSVPLFYWNAIIVYDGIYETIKEALATHPEYLNTAGKFDFGNAGFRNWWVNVATNQINNGAEEGIFIDAVPNVHATQPEHMQHLYDMMDNLPGFVIYNGFYTTNGGALLGGPESLEHGDGVYVETFFHYTCNTPAKGKQMMDALLQVPANKYIITNNAPDESWNTKDHQFGMAAHLIIANDNSFHRYYTDGSYSTNSLTIWHEDFGKYIGEPEGPATVNNYVYTRSFANAVVTLDVLNKTSSIVWRTLSTLHIQSKSFQVYPNPSTNKLNIELNNSVEKTQITIFNIIGQVVHSDQLIKKNVHTIDTSKLPMGIYTIKVTDKTNNKVFTKKFIKQ